MVQLQNVELHGLVLSTYIHVRVFSSHTGIHRYGLEGVNESTVLEEINKFLPQIENFVQTYVQPDDVTPGAAARGAGDEAGVRVVEIADIEENVWSPRYAAGARAHCVPVESSQSTFSSTCTGTPG